MNCYFLIKKQTDTLIEQTKTKPQENLEIKMNKQMQTFSFNPPINLVERRQMVTSCEFIRMYNIRF